MKIRGHSKKAYSFVEIIVSTFIFALALIPVFNLMSRSSSSARITKERVQATTLAIEVANQICSMSYADIPVVAGLPLPDTANGALLQQGRPCTKLKLSPLPKGFERELSIEKLSPKAKIVKSVISWKKDASHSAKIVRVIEWSP